MDNALKELVWVVVIVIGLGIIWLVTGGLKSPTKESPSIKPVAGQSASSTGGWFGFLFSGFGSSVSITPKINDHARAYNDIQSDSKTSSDSQPKTLYGADNPPGPIILELDKLNIEAVYPSYDQNGKAGNEYLIISALAENQKPFLITGMLLKSRMTGNQVNIRNGINVYYANALNSDEPIMLNPGETAYIITTRSPIGYSFKINKCIGYLKNGTQNFVISLPTNCPRITEYPLPARPNQFNDKCLDFLSSIGSCQSTINYPADLQLSCRTFIAERTNYSRCVTDFGNDLSFLGKDWRVYLGRTESLWKDRREIIDLIDQQGNIISTYTY